MKRKGTLRSRLILYFLSVVMIPFILFISFYLISGDSALESMLSRQAEMLIASDAQSIGSVIEGYRHKLYLAASNQSIQQAIAAGRQPTGDEARDINSTLYTIMSGDTYLAALSIISSDGSVRLSTHSFPQKYDLRSHSNAWDETNILYLAQEEERNGRSWFLSISDHRTENGYQVAFSILRRITQGGRDIGYAIIDVYSEAITPRLESGGFFSDLILTDSSADVASSLLHPQRFGPLSSFPTLKGNDIALRPINGTSLMLVGRIRSDMLSESLDSAVLYLSISLAVGIMISIMLALLFSRSISKRFSMISSGMRRFERGDFNTKLESTGIREFDSLALAFNTMVQRIEMLIDTAREEEAKAAEAERKALESQMNPHFLFNTLSTIKALARLHGEEEIYTIAVRLGRLLRYSIDNHVPYATIKESLDLAESYLMIQHIRFGSRLSYTISCPQELLEAITPRLIIQPLVENAVMHGLEGKTGNWELLISVRDEKEQLVIEVEDNGIGFDPPPDLHQLEKDGHTGLYNTKRRLELRYGRSFSFSIHSEKGRGTKVSLSLPLEEKE